MDNTYIIFTSDNGYHMGQHRLLASKGTPYEEDIHIPFIIRGPGIEAGALDGYITGNVDFAPTMAELAGVVPPDYVDGRSMVSLFKDARPSLNEWRSAYLLEFYGYNPKDEESAGEPVSKSGYVGLRTSDYLYVEYADGFVELYDLKADPYEMENVASQTDAALLSRLSQWLHELAVCAGSECVSLDKRVIK